MPTDFDSEPVRMIIRLSGLWTASLTPIDRDYRCDTARLAAFCAKLLDLGCNGIALFGTTGRVPNFPCANGRTLLTA